MFLRLCAAWFLTVAAESENACVGNDYSDRNVLLQLSKNRNSAEQRTRLVHRDKKQTPNVLFSIGTGKALENHLDACLKTWAGDLGADELQIIGGSHSVGTAHWNPALNCSDDHSGGACKDAVGLVSGYEAGAQWVMLVGPDNYVVPENVAKVLSSYNASVPIVLGIKGCGDCPAGGLCGGGGQLFSRAALQKMIAGDTNAFLQAASREARACGMWGDVQNCRLAAMNDVPVVTLPGLRGWAEEVTQIRDEMKSQSPWPLTWHYVDPEKMQAVHKLKRDVQSLEALQIVHHSSNAEQEIDYYEAMAKHVKDEDARRRIQL